jgi:hypothetical protein
VREGDADAAAEGVAAETDALGVTRLDTDAESDAMDRVADAEKEPLGETERERVPLAVKDDDRVDNKDVDLSGVELMLREPELVIVGLRVRELLPVGVSVAESVSDVVDVGDADALPETVAQYESDGEADDDAETDPVSETEPVAFALTVADCDGESDPVRVPDDVGVVDRERVPEPEREGEGVAERDRESVADAECDCVALDEPEGLSGAAGAASNRARSRVRRIAGRYGSTCECAARGRGSA